MLPRCQLRQYCLQLLATRFEEPRQLELGPKTVDRLVDGETRLVGRNLEQHATRFAEVNRAEVLAVLLLRVSQAMVPRKLFRHRRLSRVVSRAKCDVVHRTPTHAPRQ